MSSASELNVSEWGLLIPFMVVCPQVLVGSIALSMAYAGLLNRKYTIHKKPQPQDHPIWGHLWYCVFQQIYETFFL